MKEPYRFPVKRVAGKAGMAGAIQQAVAAPLFPIASLYSPALDTFREPTLRHCLLRKAAITSARDLFRGSLRQQRGMIDAKSFRQAKHEIHILYCLSRCALDQIIRYR